MNSYVLLQAYKARETKEDHLINVKNKTLRQSAAEVGEHAIFLEV